MRAVQLRVSRPSVSSLYTSITNLHHIYLPPSKFVRSPSPPSASFSLFLSRPLGYVTLPDQSICRNDVERNLFVPDSEAQPPSPRYILILSE